MSGVRRRWKWGGSAIIEESSLVHSTFGEREMRNEEGGQKERKKALGQLEKSLYVPVSFLLFSRSKRFNSSRIVYSLQKVSSCAQEKVLLIL